MEKNMSLVCQTRWDFESFGSLTSPNFLRNPTPLLMLQLIIITLLTKCMEFCLRPFAQAKIVPQILVGVVLGPSLLGREKNLSEKLFPPRDVLVLETVASFGSLFYHFLAAVKTDSSMMLRPEKVAMQIGASVFLITMILTILLAVILKTHITMEPNLNKSISLIALSQAFSGIPVISAVINDLKIQNTDVGRLALASAVFADLITIIVAATLFSTEGDVTHPLISVWSLLSTIGLLSLILFIIRPIISWMINRAKERPFVGQNYIFVVIVFALVTSFLSESIGQHYVLGPLIFGLILPDGPPFGSTLISRLDTFISGFLYPSFLTISGLQTNIFKIGFQATSIVVIITVFSFVVKMGAVMLPAMNSNVPARDAFVLGLILNARGIVEVSIYNLWRHNKLLDVETFTLCIISLVATMAIINPLIKFLYNPARQYRTRRRNTIQHSKQDSELRMLICIHDQYNVPTFINLLEISHATEDSPIDVTGLVLVKLEAKNTPILKANHPQEGSGVLDSESSSSSTSCSITNALRRYEQDHGDCISLQSFTSISHFQTMHHDICRLAMDRKATIVIIPFHKQWAIDGSVESVDRSVQHMNNNVLEKAPCSVGIVVDRRLLSGSVSVLTSKSLFDVAVLFIGGPDDVESLAYGARMARHEGVNITVFQFLLFGDENSKHRKRDSDLINEYREANMGNERFTYVEEVVRDGVGLTGLLGRIAECFDLILVGRYHQDSPLLMGLEDWSECPELGLIGDMLASPDFGSTASVLVVQQQRLNGSEKRQRLMHDTNDDRGWVTSMQK